MSVIAGTKKESVINKAREVLREKEIPYTIKRTKTWFWVSSPKPGAAQTALREAGLEMNPITTMHSIWCRKCGAIRTFEKKGKSWKCKKCGYKISVTNPGLLSMFIPKPKINKKFYESPQDWHKELSKGKLKVVSVYKWEAEAETAYMELVGRGIKPGFYTVKNTWNRYYITVKRDVITPLDILHGTENPNKVKTKVHPQAIESLKRYKSDIKAGHTSAAEYWRGQAGAYFTSNPLTKREVRFQIKLIRNELDRARNLHREGKANLARKYISQTQGRLSVLYTHGPKSMRKEVSELDSEANQLRYPNPLTKAEKREITNLANTQFAISRKYSDDPVRSSFWYGRSVGMGKIAKMFNPKVKKWDPISEILEGDEEEDNMIGAEINPLSQFCCSVCETCAPKRLLPHSKFPERMQWLRRHYMKKHPELWPWVRKENPLAAISSAAITGIGAGLGFRIAGWGWGKVAKNPAKPHTTAMVSKLPKCDFCVRTAHYDGKTRMGPWAYMCEPHFEMYGIGLGLGKGQILIVKEKGR